MQMRLGRDRVARELSAVPHPHYPTGPPPPPQTSPHLITRTHHPYLSCPRHQPVSQHFSPHEHFNCSRHPSAYHFAKSVGRVQ